MLVLFPGEREIGSVDELAVEIGLVGGFDPELVPRLQAGGQTRAITGVLFQKHVVTDAPVDLSDVWWNAEFALPGSFTTKAAGGSTRISIERIVPGVNSARLQLPPSRFPSYNMMDLADWLERD